MAAHTLTTINHPLHSFTQTFRSKTFKPQTLRCKQTTSFVITSTLRVAVIGGGPAGSSAAEALASGGVETFIFERSPEAAKPCGGAIPLCMLDEFNIPSHLIDRKVTQMKIISPSNLIVDFGKTLKPHEFIAMVRREVLDNFLRRRAADCGATLIKALVTKIELPISEKSPYIIHYNSNNTRKSLAVDVIIGADGANSKVAKSIDAGDYTRFLRLGFPQMRPRRSRDRHYFFKAKHQTVSRRNQKPSQPQNRRRENHQSRSPPHPGTPPANQSPRTSGPSRRRRRVRHEMLRRGHIFRGEEREDVRGGDCPGVGKWEEDDRRRRLEEGVSAEVGRRVLQHVQILGRSAAGVLRKQLRIGGAGGGVRQRVRAEDDVRELSVQETGEGEAGGGCEDGGGGRGELDSE